MSDSVPRRDTRGIVDPAELLSRVRFRRHAPAAELRPYLEHYWLIDWELPEPYASHVVPHPSVNVVFQRYGPLGAPASAAHASAEVSGIGLGLATHKLTETGRVCGIQFRPGGFRPFAPGWPVSTWTGRRVPLPEVFPDTGGGGAAATSGGGSAAMSGGGAAVTSGGGAAGTSADLMSAVLSPGTDHARVAALDAFLLAHGPAPDPAADRAMELVDLVRGDRSVRRVSQLAAASGLSARSLQRLFAAEVGVGPKWVILRYRIHEALERAEAAGAAGAPDWAALAAELGYSDQAHLVRDFTATIGVPPTAYARGLSLP
ncbi:MULTISPECIES: AraC family transcriptional regulator [Streptomyces]|uniref:Transcriptional regulator, AraC family n=7 Tax=Streptomyces venezuelae TaxID=54571 RepID=F2R8X9_STRVP|nr:helix-turn-helix domain-containing protein [Streptomyces venezuelae]APE22285.1 AraC family transcriptional regulator [Streptomyces venezuelae]QER99667.1 AraC family transcriptional regulator [Streptomyces venezuelae ATCC 10712]CCA56439.1 Transcriptional regulator, AraC family [Streptomyces venezuelae ATCC 10712]